jgi:hypothetical protein
LKREFKFKELIRKKRNGVRGEKKKRERKRLADGLASGDRGEKAFGCCW